MGWTLHPSKMGYDSGRPNTSDIRRQLAVTREKKELGSRGVLALDPTQALSERISNLQSAGLYDIMRSGQTLGLAQDSDWQSDNSVTKSHNVAAHDVHTTLFQDILNTTNNPAYAVQALSTTLYQMQYSGESYRWIYSHSASYVMAQEVPMPVQKTGLLTVVGCRHPHHSGGRSRFNVSPPHPGNLVGKRMAERRAGGFGQDHGDFVGGIQ
ncbi:uncharacterized protein PG986_000490 [Apiospora aurea]|uniref:Uncharacterized protein n=1 Tax=Apiospora aurea TaxID=335848 RepID=A0ABR1QUT6_9PEZI